MPVLFLDDLAQKTPIPGFTGRFVHSEHMTLAYWTVEAGAELPEHAHPHEQVTHMIEGQFTLTIDGETETLGPGCVGMVPSNARHSGKALTPCRIMDVFYPVREDYR